MLVVKHESLVDTSLSRLHPSLLLIVLILGCCIPQPLHRGAGLSRAGRRVLLPRDGYF